MNLSREARLVSAVILIAVPTVMYGGLTLLGVLTGGSAGLLPGNLQLDDTQAALWRAGHAHAGVWLIISLLLQLFLDAARLATPLLWLARISAPVAAVTVSAGFFGLAFAPAFRWVLYFGGTSLVVAVLLTAIGLLRGGSAREHSMASDDRL